MGPVVKKIDILNKANRITKQEVIKKKINIRNVS